MACRRSNSQTEDEELQTKLKEAFDEVDTNKNGYISTDDLRKVFEKSGYEVTEKALQVKSLIQWCKK